MKTVITTLSVHIVRMEVEGINVLDRIARINRSRMKVSLRINLLWKKFVKNPSEEILAEIETYQEVLRDYEEELIYLINGIED